MNTKLSLKSGDKLRCHQALSPIKCFDNSLFPLSVEKGGDQETIYKNDSVSHVSLFQSRGMFLIRKKNEKTKQLNFSCFIQTWLSIPSQLPRQQQLSSFFWIYFQTENNKYKRSERGKRN